MLKDLYLIKLVNLVVVLNIWIIKGRFKHGGKGTRLYQVWKDIKQRILNPKHKAYKDYGGRGITICNEWLEFIPFRDWALSKGYTDNLEIDRKNTKGNYEPLNCHFVTRTGNLRNTRRNVIKSIEIANKIRYLYSTGKLYSKRISYKIWG